MRTLLFTILLLTIPTLVSPDVWDAETHYKYLRAYHGREIAIATDFSHFLRPDGERCRLRGE